MDLLWDLDLVAVALEQVLGELLGVERVDRMSELEATFFVLFEDVGADHQLLSSGLDGGELLVTEYGSFRKCGVGVIILITGGLAFFCALEPSFFVANRLLRVLSHIEGVYNSVNEHCLFSGLLANALPTAARSSFFDFLLDAIDYSLVGGYCSSGVSRSSLRNRHLNLFTW